MTIVSKLPNVKTTILTVKKLNPLLDMLGANGKSRAFESPAEADKYIKDLRNEWA